MAPSQTVASVLASFWISVQLYNLLLILEFKETVGLHTKSKRGIQALKINQKYYGK